jgi:beta-lactamase superfamily II metal-dependent hydrolase
VETLAPHPPPGYAAGRRNEEGLILRVRHGNHSFLLTGDAEPRTERLLLDAGLLERADVLKVAHHGSRHSSRTDFLDAVRPVFALISAGRDNAFGFPAPRVLQDLEARAVMILRTDLMGLVTIRSDGRRLTAEFPARESAALPRMEPF